MITFLFYYFLIAIFIGLFFIHTLDNIKNILPEDEYRKKMRQTIVNFMPFLPIALLVVLFWKRFQLFRAIIFQSLIYVEINLKERLWKS